MNCAEIYLPFLSHCYLFIQEKERAIIRWINSCGISAVENKRALEIGGGLGGNLLDLLKLRFQPKG